MSKYKKPIRVTLSVSQITELEYMLKKGVKIKDIATHFKCSTSKITNNMKLLGLKKASDDFNNKIINIQIAIPRKHYAHAYKRFKAVISKEYTVADNVHLTKC